MASVSQKILTWLYSVLTEYHHVNRAYSDIAQLISQYPSFSLRTDVYTYENGQSLLLVNAAGTLPVIFQGATYMFPISIWVPQEYPKAAPMALVTPTANMLIRPGQHVSGEGRIYHPYLAGWLDDRSSITEFLSILQELFARDPPVISRQEQVPQVQTAPRPTLPLNPIQNPPPIPPLPPELGRSDTRSGMRQAAPASNNRPPQLPPKPFPSINQSQKYLNGPPPSQPYSRAVDERYRYSKNEYVQDYPKNMPPMPGNVQHSFNNLNREYVPTTPKQQSARLNEQQSHQESYSPVSPLTPERKLDASFSSDESRRLIWTCCHCGSPCNVSLSPDRCSTCAHPRCNLCQAQFTQQGYTQQNLTQSHPTSSISTSESMENWHNKYHLQSLQQQSSGIHTDSRFPIIGISQKNKPSTKPMEDLLTSPFETPLPAPAADVAPPPIPPNPQKDAILSALSQTLTQQIRSTYDSNMGAIPPLRAQQSALQSTLTAINNEISQLNDLQVLLSSNEAILHKAMHNADQVMEDAKHRKIPGVDEVLVAPTIVAGQLYALVADQRSIEDCRGVLGRALDRGRIAPEVWAKQTRSLAREEFLKKALVKKIAMGMGLAEEQRWE